MNNYYEEAHYQILHKTACRIQNHAFIWTSNRSDSAIPRDCLCDCGAWSWQSLNEKLKKTEGEMT